jgi:hypothetical protein
MEVFEMDEILNGTNGAQIGAEGAGAPGATDNGNGEGHGTGNEPRVYSAEELQSETDRRVNEALNTARAKWEKEYGERLEREKEEAAKRAKMTAEERAKTEFEDAQKKFAEEKASYDRERLEFDCTKQLASANLPVEFASMLTGADNDATKANIESFATAFNKAVENAVNTRMKAEPPKVGGQPNNSDPFLAGFNS